MDVRTSSSLPDFLEENGFKCPICIEPYDLEDKQKKPTQLSCGQHNLCIACFVKHRDTLETCPECRKTLTPSTATPVVNSQVVNAIQLATQLWKATHVHPAPTCTPTSPLGLPCESLTALSLAKPEQAHPEHFECLSYLSWEFPNVTETIVCMLPDIVKTMRWESISQELTPEISKKPETWLLMRDQRTKTPHAIVQLIGTFTQWEMHWGGVTEDKPALYIELYKNLLASLAKQQKQLPDDWKTLSLTTFFNYDIEEKWLNSVLGLLQQHSIRFELTYLHKPWGTQAKLTVFPISKIGHTQTPLVLDPNLLLEKHIPFEKWVSSYSSELLIRYNLHQLFRLSCVREPSPEAASECIKQTFLQRPHNFFIYIVNGKAEGFIQFTRSHDTFRVQTCRLLPEAEKFAHHFVQEFIGWATTQESYAKGRPAKNVTFNETVLSQLHGALYEAVVTKQGGAP